MKQRLLISSSLLIVCMFFTSCKKQEYFKSESGIKKELKGEWSLLAVPKYDLDQNGNQFLHVETWTFDDSKVTIVNNGVSGTSDYSVNTTWTKAEVKLEGITAPLAAQHYDGTWQIVQLDDTYLIIANDHDGSTGLTELEFKKK